MNSLFYKCLRSDVDIKLSHKLTVKKPFSGTRVEKDRINGTAGRQVRCRYDTDVNDCRSYLDLYVDILRASNPLASPHGGVEDTALMR